MIKRYAPTDKEKEAYHVFKEVGSMRAAAKELGISYSAVRQRIEGYNKKTRDAGAFTPAEEPSEHYTTKTTVEYDAQGNPVREWRRLSPIQRALETFTDRLVEKAKEKGTAPKPPKKTDTGHLLELLISDAHIGMFAWAKETGKGDYDVKTATDTVLRAVDKITSRCNPEETIIVFNGDSMHSDSRANKTEKSGHILDVDTRFVRVLDHTIECLKQSVDMAAKRAKRVKVLVTPGNHDWHTAHCLSRVLDAYYSRSKNVSVIVSARPRYAMQWGNCMIAWAHGDGIKPGQWASIVPTEFPELWGRTKNRFLHLGHIHHKKAFAPVAVDEQCGVVVEYVSALCQIDAWAAENGYIGAQRGAEGFLYTKEGLDTRWYFGAN